MPRELWLRAPRATAACAMSCGTVRGRVRPPQPSAIEAAACAGYLQRIGETTPTSARASAARYATPRRMPADSDVLCQRCGCNSHLCGRRISAAFLQHSRPSACIESPSQPHPRQVPKRTALPPTVGCSPPTVGYSPPMLGYSRADHRHQARNLWVCGTTHSAHCRTVAVPHAHSSDRMHAEVCAQCRIPQASCARHAGAATSACAPHVDPMHCGTLPRLHLSKSDTI